MAVNLLVRSRKFFSQLANGETFAANLTDFGTHLKGSVMEKVKAVYQVDISWDSASTSSAVFTLIGGLGDNIITRATGSFIDDGFSVGDEVEAFVGAVIFLSGPRTILIVDDTTMILDGAAMSPDGDYVDMTLRGVTDLTGYIHQFGLIENDEVFNFISKVEGSDQVYSADGVGLDSGGGRITTLVNGIANGTVLGWQSGTFKIRYVSNPSTYVQRYEFEHEFIILPYYVEGNLSLLQNVPVLQPDILNGNNTIKYVSRLEFRNELSNPNTSKTVTDEIELGSVGGFNERYNGLPHDYNIDSIAYEKVSDATVLTGLSRDVPTKVTIVVNSAAKFTGASIFGVYHSLLPKSEDYENKATLFQSNFLYDNKIQTIGAGAVSSSIITSVVGTLLSASQISIVFEVDYTLSQEGQIAENDNFVIAAQVSDTSLDTDNSDKVILLAAAGEYVVDDDIPGLVTLASVQIFPHPNATTTGGTTNFTDYKGWNEDGINVSFNLSTLLTEAATIEACRVNLVAYNSTTGNSFVLDSYAFPIGTAVFSGLYQQISLLGTRGYALQSDDFFNLAELTSSNEVVGSNLFKGKVGLKIRWEDWISLPDADTVFFDGTELNDGLNEKSSNYSLKEGYAIKVFVEAEMSQGGGATLYRFASADFDIRDYDLDDNISPEWIGTIRTFTSLSNEITPVIQDTEDTRIEITWSNPANEPITDITDYYIIHRIEETNSIGQVIEELSSLTNRRPSDNSYLIPLSGETRTKISIVAGKIVSECLVDYNLIDPDKTYKISGRIGSISNTPVPLLPSGKQKEDGVFKKKEDGDNKRVEV